MSPAIIDLREKLEAAGFSFHSGNGKHWYCWCGPNGKWDVECGEDCDLEELAILSAVDTVIACCVTFQREAEHYPSITAAAQAVISQWEHGDLAGAARELDMALTDAGEHPDDPPPNAAGSHIDPTDIVRGRS